MKRASHNRLVVPVLFILIACGYDTGDEVRRTTDAIEIPTAPPMYSPADGHPSQRSHKPGPVSRTLEFSAAPYYSIVLRARS